MRGELDHFEWKVGRRVVNTETGAELWRSCEGLPETLLILSTFPVLEGSDGEPEGSRQEPLQGMEWWRA